MSTTGAQQTVSFILDARIAIESLLLNRCSKIPEKRREDWLRHLMVSGFLFECQLLKAGEGGADRPPLNTGASQEGYAHWLMTQRRKSQPPATTTASLAPCVKESLNADGSVKPNYKPFAALGQVVG